MIRILVVDDLNLIRMGISKMLDNILGIKVVGEAINGEEAVKLAGEMRPNVVLMDIKMPGIGGLEATRKLLRIDPDLKVIVVTACDDNIFPTRMLRAGASGYLTKNAQLNEIVQAIKSVHAGQCYIAPVVAKQLALQHITNNNVSPLDVLSQRELQVMLMITRGDKPQEISKKLNLSPKTINTYRYRIFDKLDLKNDVELILLSIRHKLLEIPIIQ